MNPAPLAALRRPPPSWLSPGQFVRTFRLALRSLWLHRLRSLLTVLGIVFGVCSVIAMLAIGEGASFEAQEQIKNLGSQNIILRSVKPTEEQKITERANESIVIQYGLTYADLRRVQATIPGVTVVVPGRLIREFVWHLSRRVDCEVMGTVPWYLQMRNQRLAEGRFFTDAEMDASANVCVLGWEMVPRLFPLTSPLGETVRVRDSYYRVIGILEPRGKSIQADNVGEANKGPSVDRMFIPLNTAKRRYGEVIERVRTGTVEAERVELHEVTVKVDKLGEVVDVSQAIENVLKRNHKKADYQIVVPLELLKRAERTKEVFNIVLGSIAAISLLVGGIGIMNIMLASVTERTREIGVRRALGARRRDITVQFLVETVILSGAGGLLGVALGLAIPWFVTLFAGMKTIVTLWAPLLAFSISALVGVVFGLYPALRAANMDPVEALRHE